MAFNPLAALTGSAYDSATDQQRSYLSGLQSQIQGQVAGAQNKGLAALTTGTAGAVGAINPAIAQGRTDISGSVDPAIAAIYGGQNLGSLALTGAVDPATAALYGGAGAAAGAYDPLKGLAVSYGNYGGQNNQAIADALGLNGPEGTTRAQAAFQAGPGYQWQMQQGADAIARGRNVTGEAASGNTDVALQQFGQGLANQEWNKYLTNLKQQQDLFNPLAASATGTAAAGEANAALTAGTGAANIYTGTGSRLADLYSTTAGRAAPVYTGAGTSLADLAKTGGLATGNILQQGGQSQADLIKALTGLGVGAEQNIGSLYSGTYGAQAAADTAASKNLLDLGGNLVTGLAGGGFLPSFTKSAGLGFGTPYGSAAPKTNTIFNLNPTG